MTDARLESEAAGFPAIETLIGISEPLQQTRDASNGTSDYLRPLYAELDGFYAYQRALLVRPIDSDGPVLGIRQWNEPSWWRSDLVELLRGWTVFAECVDGLAWAVSEPGQVAKFDHEAGELEHFSDSVEGWARRVLENPNVVGAGLASRWNELHGEIQIGHRLPPEISFVFTESESAGNVECHERFLAEYRAEIWNTIRSVDDGRQVHVKTLVQAMETHGTAYRTIGSPRE